MRLRHVADVRFWARLRTQKRSDERIDAGHVCGIASGASWAPLKIRVHDATQKVRKATWETPKCGLEITSVRKRSSSDPGRFGLMMW